MLSIRHVTARTLSARYRAPRNGSKCYATQQWASIPVIDFSALNDKNPSAEAKNKIGDQVREALSTTGFFGARNIGVDGDLVREVFDVTKNMFALPTDVKQKAANENPYEKGNVAGYSGFGAENFSYARGDHKESFNILRNVDERKWPGQNTPVGTEFKQRFETFFDLIEQGASKVVKMCAVSLGLEENSLKNMHWNEESATQLRALHYPGWNSKDNIENERIGAHTDYGTFSMLWQDGVSGLEMFHPQQKEWLPIKSYDTDICLVNTADLLERWSNGVYTSARHQVVPHMKDNGQIPTRYSMVYTLHPDKSVEVKPLSSPVIPDMPRFEPVNAFEHAIYRNELVVEA